MEEKLALEELLELASKVTAWTRLSAKSSYQYTTAVQGGLGQSGYHSLGGTRKVTRGYVGEIEGVCLEVKSYTSGTGSGTEIEYEIVASSEDLFLGSETETSFGRYFRGIPIESLYRKIEKEIEGRTKLALESVRAFLKAGTKGDSGSTEVK